jgi:spoIIIJ-associated protein
MNHEIEKEAPTVEEAIDAALDELGVQADAAEFEVLQEPSRKLFGGSSSPARVRVWLKPGVADELSREDIEPAVPDEAETEEEALPQELLAPSTAVPELTEEELDEIADAAVSAIQSVLASFGIQASIDEYEGDEGEIILDIVGGGDLGILIGRHGRTLDAMQVVVSAITGRTVGRRYPIVVDVEGYRGRRREKLEDMAKRTADRVARQGRPVKLRPMNSYERRVVHMALREDRRVVTGSEGEDPFRQVVISPK